MADVKRHLRLWNERWVQDNSLVRGLTIIAGLFLLLLLGLYNQPYYPRTWQDEGFVLQGAMNLVRSGQYAMRSAEGYRILDQPLIANGPGIVLPLAAAFELLGTGLFQARLASVAFFLLAAVVFFAVAKRLYGPVSAFLSLFLLLALPLEGFLLYGRHALGNVPALAYFLLGYLFWLGMVERGGVGYALGTGLFWGLAVVTKGQYGLIFPMLLIVLMLDWLYYRHIGVLRIALVVLVAAACLGLWYAVQLALVGWENFGQHLDAVQASARVTVFAFRPMRVPGTVWYLVRSGWLLIVAPGLVYVGWCCRRRDLDSLRQVPLVAFVVVWTLWYVFTSVGWHRYAFAPYAVGSIMAGKFIVDALRFWLEHRGFSTARRLATVSAWSALLLVLAMLLAGVWGLGNQVRGIAAAPDRSPQEFADYLRSTVGPEAVIESWEWEIDALADLTFHHPTNDWVDKLTAVTQFGERDPGSWYDIHEHTPSYLIDGPFSKWTRLYEPSLVSGCCTPVITVGRYDLYRVNAPEGD